MEANKIKLMLLVGILINSSICSQLNESNSTVTIKQAKGRLKAIARGYMVENQKNTNPFELHQNWRHIKKDIYKKLEKESYLNEQNQRIVNEDVMPMMTDKVFRKLAQLKLDAPKEKRTKYIQSPDLIDIKASTTLVRDRLRKHGIKTDDRPILFKEIMLELEKHMSDHNMLNRRLVKKTADEMITKFRFDKSSLQKAEPKSYLQDFIAGWKTRFTDQIGKQDWTATQ